MDELASIRDLIARHIDPERGLAVERTSLPGIRLAVSDSTTMPSGDVASPALAIVVQGAKQTELNDRTYRYGAGRYLVVGAELPVTGAITEADREKPFLAFVMELDPVAIAALLLQTGDGGRESAGSDCAMAVGDAGPGLLGATARLLGLLDHPEDREALAPLYEREILWRLLGGEQGAMVRRIGLADSRLTQIARSIGWIRGHYAEPLSVGRLAGISSMSVSSFHRHFRAVTRMTPLQFQRQLRLQEARALLTSRPGDVAGAGFAVGYVSPSQFSREYRRMYGIAPGRDGARLNAMASG